MVLPSRAALDAPRPRAGVRFTGIEPERMTAARLKVLEIVRPGLAWSKRDVSDAAGVSTGVIDGLVKTGSLQHSDLAPETIAYPLDADFSPVEFTGPQRQAADRLRASIGKGYAATLLHGVTGSGKTEVYFEAIAEALRQNRQALVLLPEIALTGQFLTRFEKRFGARPVEWHSGLTPRRRELAWSAVHRGEARVVVGARSALFLPFHDLGLIVVDEEHDPAYKQSDRVTYHARDMAVVRGFIADFPVILASATPSIETRVNVDAGKYLSLSLPARYSGQPLPDIRLIDLRANPPPRGNWLSPLLVDAVGQALADGRQALLFLNRRGYAPLTLCRKCGYRFMCPQCSSWLVQHRFRNQLQCHHCGFAIGAPDVCPSCQSENSLVPCGPGVERIADEARALFPDARIAVLSSDLIHSVPEMQRLFAEIEAGQYDIIVGTQLIAKGHHFPLLTVVGVVDADLGLGQGDLRAAERTFQLLHQVVGRAGRESVPGTGYLQTHMPEHPVMEALASGDAAEFYGREIAARERFALPPFGHLASLLITGKDKALVAGFARKLAQAAPKI
ncbi:MAG: primosomal protein N', partial [Fimbriimonadaceae bacterium]|nr:primosomal protein N' [Alphaproteobacteria bacterium]